MAATGQQLSTTMKALMVMVMMLMMVVEVVEVRANTPRNEDGGNSSEEEKDGGGGNFKLTILHINDLHARFEETNVYSGRCTPRDKEKNNCFGGFAR